MRQTRQPLASNASSRPSGHAYPRWSESVTFGGGGGLDRAAHLRGDSTKLAMLWAGGQARVLPVWRGKPLIAERLPGRLGWVGADHPILAQAAPEPAFLGFVAGTAHFAADVSALIPESRPGPRSHPLFDPSEQSHPATHEGGSFRDLRGVMSGLSRLEAELGATARALFTWQRETRFCGRCGSESGLQQAGWLRACPKCGARQFPRIEPAVIMLVVHQNAVLVGRESLWPDGLYSLLAGFVEVGETFEGAARREVLEETGVRVGDVRYLASQPWPFPGQQMIGCYAEALTTEITLGDKELHDARWITREEMMMVLSGRHETLRTIWKGSLAHFLLRNWLADRLF